MAKGAVLNIDITADAADAVAGLDKASGAIKGVAAASDDASSRMSKVHDGIGTTGDTAAMATTGLRDLGGAMETMGGTAGQVGSAMVGMSTAFEAMDGAATLYAAAQSAASGAATVFNTVMKALRVTLLTNPIFIIAAVIIGIAIALVVAYKKSETFRNIVNAAFRGVLAVITAVWNWIRNNWKLLLTILTGPIGLAVRTIATHWGSIKTGANAVITWFKTTWASLSTLLAAPFKAGWSVIDGVIDNITSAIDRVIGWIGRIKFPSMPSWMDAVLPGSFAAAPAVRGVSRAPAATSPRSGGGGVSITVNGALDPEGVARQIRRILDASDRRGGRLGVLRPVGTV